jgi:hypothetical protein
VQTALVLPIFPSKSVLNATGTTAPLISTQPPQYDPKLKIFQFNSAPPPTGTSIASKPSQKTQHDTVDGRKPQPDFVNNTPISDPLHNSKVTTIFTVRWSGNPVSTFWIPQNLAFGELFKKFRAQNKIADEVKVDIKWMGMRLYESTVIEKVPGVKGRRALDVDVTVG